MSQIEADDQSYLCQVLGDPSAPVGIRNLSVLQIHSLPAHILVQQNRTIVGP